MLFFPGEWITYVLLVLVGLLDLRSQWCRQSLDKLAQCTHAFISFTDFIFLKMYRKDTIGWNTPLRCSQSCWILFNGRGRSVYRFGRHLELHELCFSTENLPGCMDLQKAHISNFSLKQHTQQKQRGPLHFCSCTIAPMAYAVQQLRQNPKTFETFALFVSDDHFSKREQILQCVWRRMGIRLVSSSWRACYVRLSSCPTLVITASPHTKSDPVCTNATLRSVFKSTGSQTSYS